MIKNKIIKLFLVLSVVFCSIICMGCSNDKIYEKENKEIVNFSKKFFSLSFSSIPGQPIELTLDNAVFLCEVEKASFDFRNDVKEYRIKSGEKVFYCPYYSVGDSFTIIEEDEYVDITILIEEKIVGYAVIKMNYEKLHMWTPELIASNLFINKDGSVIDVSEDYVSEKIRSYHE